MVKKNIQVCKPKGIVLRVFNLDLCGIGGRGGSAKNFPGVGGIDPLIIPANHFTFHFHSDGSNTVSFMATSTLPRESFFV